MPRPAATIGPTSTSPCGQEPACSPGQVIGESDKLGQEPLTEAITPAMVGTTMLDAAGVDTQALAELRVSREEG